MVVRLPKVRFSMAGGSICFSRYVTEPHYKYYVKSKVGLSIYKDEELSAPNCDENIFKMFRYSTAKKKGSRGTKRTNNIKFTMTNTARYILFK